MSEVPAPDPYAHLKAIIEATQDPHAKKAAQDLLDRLTAKNPAPAETPAS